MDQYQLHISTCSWWTINLYTLEKFKKSILGSGAALIVCWNGIEKHHTKSIKSYLSRKYPTFQVNQCASNYSQTERDQKVAVIHIILYGSAYTIYYDDFDSGNVQLVWYTVEKILFRLVLSSLFSTMITRKIKDIDTLIDSLPSEDSTKRLQDAALESMNAGLSCTFYNNTKFTRFLFWINTWQGLSELYFFREWKARRWITAFCKWSGSITFTNIGHISRHSRYPTGCKTGKFYSLALALSNISISSESESPSMIRPFWLSSKSYLKRWVYGYIHNGYI